MNESVVHWCQGFLNGTRLDSIWQESEYAMLSLLPLGVLSKEFDLKGKKDTDGNLIENDLSHKEIFKNNIPKL